MDNGCMCGCLVGAFVSIFILIMIGVVVTEGDEAPIRTVDVAYSDTLSVRLDSIKEVPVIKHGFEDGGHKWIMLKVNGDYSMIHDPSCNCDSIKTANSSSYFNIWD